MIMLRSLHRRLIFIVAAVLFIVGAGLYFASAGRNELEEIAVPPAQSGTPMPTAAAVSSDERAFYEYVGARLRAMSAESQELIKLGNERSRNVVELQVRSNRVIGLADQIDEYIESRTPPARFVPAVAQYEAGVQLIRSGIADAKSAVLRFDWDAVATALDVFENGTNQLDTAFQMMRDSVGADGTMVAS
jgi:hypothetical protein